MKANWKFWKNFFLQTWVCFCFSYSVSQLDIFLFRFGLQWENKKLFDYLLSLLSGNLLLSVVSVYTGWRNIGIVKKVEFHHTFLKLPKAKFQVLNFKLVISISIVFRKKFKHDKLYLIFVWKSTKVQILQIVLTTLLFHVTSADVEEKSKTLIFELYAQKTCIFDHLSFIRLWFYSKERFKMSTELPELLCRVNFPLYQATMITPRHIMVAGGGGAANTGVFNGIVS